MGSVMGWRLTVTVFTIWAAAVAVLLGIRIAEVSDEPESAEMLPATDTDWIPVPPGFAWGLKIEDRLAALEQQWTEHDKTYHFTCEYEDCLTVDELLALGYDGRDR